MKGKVHILGDNIDTDMLAPGGYLHMSIDRLKSHCLEAVKENWSEDVKEGDIVIAGKNFGCGSSREQAPIVLKELGVRLVIASSFARIFFRNAVNVGLPIGVADLASTFDEGDSVEYDIKNGSVFNGQKYEFTGVSGPLLTILEKGGLINYVKEELKNQ